MSIRSSLRILVLVPGPKERLQDREKKQIQRWTSEEVILETVVLPDDPLISAYPLGHAGMKSEYHASRAGLLILKEIVKAEDDGFDAIIINCFADPLLEAAREVSSLPVVGCGQASVLTALSLGERIGIINVKESVASFIRRNMVKYGIANNITYWDTVVPDSIDIHEDEVKTRDALIETCRRAEASNKCDVIVLGCTAFQYMWEEANVRLSIPVVKPFPCAVKFAELFVNLGVLQSRCCYPKEPRLELQE